MNSFYLCRPPAWKAGLTNQLYTLINAIIIARAERCPFLLVEGFNPHYDSEIHCQISDIIDLTHLNTLFSDLTILDQATADLKIDRIEYGSYFKLVDLTDILLPEFYQDGTFSLPPSVNLNSIRGDPEPYTPKKLFVHFQINSIKSHVSYAEKRSDWIKFGLKEANPLPMMLAVNKFNHGEFVRIMSQIRFHSRFSELAQNFIQTVVDSPRLNVIHLRVEPDARHHWGQLNHYSPGNHPELFGDRLYQIYIDLIDRYLDPTIPLLVLTGTPSNPVVDYLLTKGYRVCVGPKGLVQGRELNAILDLLLGGHCTDVFIGNINPHTFTGSSFSYALLVRMASTVTKVLLDLEHIETPPYVGFQF